MKPAHRIWTLNDIKPRDIELLAAAVAAPEKSFMCFGLAWHKLFDLHMIDEDSSPTKYGREIVHAYARITHL